MNEDNDLRDDSFSLLDLAYEEEDVRESKLWFSSVILIVFLLPIIMLIPNSASSPFLPHLLLFIAVLYWYSFSFSRLMLTRSQEVTSLVMALLMTTLAILITIVSITNNPLLYFLSLMIPILSPLIIFLGFSEFYGGKLVFWSLVILNLLTVGAVLILLNINYSFPEMGIEMAGAFVGLGGAIALGELLKALQSRGDSKKLHRALLEELNDILKELNEHKSISIDQREDIPFPIWHATLYSSEILSFDSTKRKKLTNAYYMISKYNEANTDTRIQIAIDTILELSKKEDISEESTESEKVVSENKEN